MFGKTRDIKRRLIKESGGSFRIAHTALKEVANETGSTNLDLQEVVSRIRAIRKQFS